MAVTSKVLIPAKQAEAAQTVQYTANNVTAYIDKFTVTNNAATAILLSVNLVASGGIAGTDNLIMNQRAIAPKETYSAVELTGQILEPGATISTIASAGASLTIRASGREIT